MILNQPPFFYIKRENCVQPNPLSHHPKNAELVIFSLYLAIKFSPPSRVYNKHFPARPSSVSLLCKRRRKEIAPFGACMNMLPPSYDFPPPLIRRRGECRAESIFFSFLFLSSLLPLQRIIIKRGDGKIVGRRGGKILCTMEQTGCCPSSKKYTMKALVLFGFCLRGSLIRRKKTARKLGAIESGNKRGH